MRIDIPLLHQVDVLVVGGSTGAVEAALSAAQAGCSVLCASSHTYLGEDVCAPAAYWPEHPYPLTTDLARRILPELPEGRLPRPMLVKYALEQALIRAGVPFLYMTHAILPLRAADGRMAGAVIANRSGFQAVAASTVIDATEHAQLARRFAGVSFRDFVPGQYAATHVVAGAPATDSADQRLMPLPGRFDAGERELMPYRCATEHRLQAVTVDAMAAVDVASRMAAWYPGQLLAADVPCIRLDDGLNRPGGPMTAWTDAKSYDLEICRAGNHSAFVLGPQAAVTGEAAEALAQPGPLMAVGRRLGTLAAEEARRLGRAPGGASSCASERLARDLEVLYPDGQEIAELEVVRRDRYFRADGAPSLALDLNRLPQLDACDVVVVGGGTAGAPAGIAAARAGARTLILEYLPGLGGMGTRGRIACYYHGNRCGFTNEVDAGVAAMGEEPEFDPKGPRWNTDWKEHWFLETARRAGARVWFHALTVAAAVDAVTGTRNSDARIRGVVVVTPYGFGLVRAQSVVDATGNADVAAAAGAPTVTTGGQHVAVQGTGLAPFIPGAHYTNTDHTFIDDTDVVDVSRAFAVARAKFRDAFDLTLVVDSRQRRQIRGDLTLEPVDFLAQRTFPDTITTARSNFDTHGFTIHPLFLAVPPDKESHWAHVPLRCLLPEGVQGILVTGLGVSCHRDALPVIRMQPDVQNQGYAAGRAAAMAAAADVGLRDLDVRQLQRHLVEVGILAAEVVGHGDSFPLPDAEFQQAVAGDLDDHRSVAVLFSDPERAQPLLRQAYAGTTEPSHRLRCAQVLALMGDTTGLDALIKAVEAADWDEGWHYTGMGQFGFSLSPVDSMLAALGFAGDAQALPAVLHKLAALRPEHAFSHFRALTLALERIPSAEATPALSALLDQIKGHAITDLGTAVCCPAADSCDTSERNRELKELLLARGLLACGDHQDQAREVLAAYSRDLHGHYARHARALLAARDQTPSRNRA